MWAEERRLPLLHHRRPNTGMNSLFLIPGPATWLQNGLLIERPLLRVGLYKAASYQQMDTTFFVLIHWSCCDSMHKDAARSAPERMTNSMATTSSCSFAKVTRKPKRSMETDLFTTVQHSACWLLEDLSRASSIQLAEQLDMPTIPRRGWLCTICCGELSVSKTGSR